jgi:hypothetical protein
VPQAGNRPRVGLGLEQPVHELGLEAANGRRRGFQPEVRLEPARQDVAVLSPPVRRVGLPGQRDELRPHVLVVHAVQGQQVAQVAALQPDPAVFQAADLGPGSADLVTGLLGCDPGGLTEAPQLSAEQHAQDRRIDGRLGQVGKWLLAPRPHSDHRLLPC